MTEYISTICLLLPLVTVALVNANRTVEQPAARPQLKIEDWAPAYYKAFAKQGNLVGHEKVLELLKELKRVHDPFSNEETNGRKAEINRLLEVASRDMRKCIRSYLHHIHDLMETNYAYRKNILLYLRHHFSDYVSFCEKTVLHSNVARISNEHKADMQELADTLSKVKVDGVALGELTKGALRLDYLSIGLVSFLEHKCGAQLKTDTLPKFKDLFETHVMGMCRSWTEATDPARALNEFFVEVEFDENETKWLDYGTLCHGIERGHTRLVPRLFRGDKKSLPIRKRVKRILRKLSCLDRGAIEE